MEDGSQRVHGVWGEADEVRDGRSPGRSVLVLGWFPFPSSFSFPFPFSPHPTAPVRCPSTDIRTVLISVMNLRFTQPTAGPRL
jgi:hypothetical protein